jgi:tetratricopeptide (TPR) repeat protein
MGFFGLFPSQKEKESQDMLMRGMYLFAGGMHNQAIFFCDRALELNPDLVPALHIKGSAMGMMGSYEKALSFLGRAVYLDPDFIPAWFVMGLTLGELHKFSEAVLCFDRVIASGPYYWCRWPGFNEGRQSRQRYSDAMYSRAMACMESGNYHEAQAGYQRALEFDPDNPLARDLQQKLEKSPVF